MEKLIIAGSGPAGLTAALYAARANIDPLLVEGAQAGGIAGGQLMYANIVENFPGFPKGLAGPELIKLMRDQVNAYGVRIISTDIIEASLRARPFAITCSDGTKFEMNALIIATGASARRLPLESEKKYWGKGVSSCANCDGGLSFFRNKPLAIIGGGDTALSDALHLTQFSSTIFIIHQNSTFNASSILQQRVINHGKIKIFWNKTVVEFLGNDVLTGLKLKDAITGDIMVLNTDGAFEAIGHSPNTAVFKGQVNMDESGYILNQPGTAFTSVEGIFAAGDVVDKKYRQAVTAAGTGCMAAMEAECWLQEKRLLG